MKREQFEEYLERDLAWRKMEISQLFQILNESKSKQIVFKSIILLLYAHWEGFIKKSSKYYLKYVSEKKIKIKELTLNFKAIVLKDYASKCINGEGLNLSNEIALIKKQEHMEEKKFKINVNIDDDLDTDIINTKHNLNSKVLRNITEIIGTRYNNAMQTRANYIDAQLLYRRNTIGHGSKISKKEIDNSTINFQDIMQLKDFVLLMLDYYTDVLMEYVVKEYYLILNNDKREEYEKEKEKKLELELKKLEERYKGVIGNDCELQNFNTI